MYFIKTKVLKYYSDNEKHILGVTMESLGKCASDYVDYKVWVQYNNDTEFEQEYGSSNSDYCKHDILFLDFEDLDSEID